VGNNVLKKHTVSIFRASSANFSPEDGDSVFLGILCIYLRVYMASKTQKNYIILTAVRTLNLTGSYCFSYFSKYSL
jgi:hypothetical protein